MKLIYTPQGERAAMDNTPEVVEGPEDQLLENLRDTIIEYDLIDDAEVDDLDSIPDATLAELVQWYNQRSEEWQASIEP